MVGIHVRWILRRCPQWTLLTCQASATMPLVLRRPFKTRGNVYPTPDSHSSAVSLWSTLVITCAFQCTIHPRPIPPSSLFLSLPPISCFYTPLAADSNLFQYLTRPGDAHLPFSSGFRALPLLTRCYCHLPIPSCLCGDICTLSSAKPALAASIYSAIDDPSERTR